MWAKLGVDGKRKLKNNAIPTFSDVTVKLKRKLPTVRNWSVQSNL